MYRPVYSDLLTSILGSDTKRVFFRKRQLIFSVGGRSDAMFLIEGGGVKLTLTSRRGREAVIGILRKGDLFGYEVFDQSCPRRFVNAVALTDVWLRRVDRKLISETMALRSTACLEIISLLVRLLSQVQLELANNLSCGSDERLARALLSIDEVREECASARRARISQQELADMIGTTRQRVNSILQRFKKMGLIDCAQGLHVHDSLRSMAQYD